MLVIGTFLKNKECNAIENAIENMMEMFKFIPMKYTHFNSRQSLPRPERIYVCTL